MSLGAVLLLALLLGVLACCIDICIENWKAKH
jgi:hypothetical protein